MVSMEEIIDQGAAERMNIESENERAPIKKLRKELLKGNHHYDMLTNVYSPSLNISTNPQFTGLVNEGPLNKSSVSKRILDQSILMNNLDASKVGKLLLNHSLVSVNDSVTQQQIDEHLKRREDNRDLIN